MQIDIKGRNVPVTDELREHAERRMRKVTRQVSDLARLEIEIFPTSAVIEPGHSLRLTIATGDFPHETSTLSTETSSLGVDTLYLGAGYPSSIYLGTVSPPPAS